MEPATTASSNPETGPRFLVGPGPAKAMAVVGLVLAFLYGGGVLSLVGAVLGWLALRSLSCLMCSSLWRSTAWAAISLGALGVVSSVINRVA